ncbi:MAG TPA: prolyl oligopeptidase family serine peptidase [Steroidobacteraceae bacterium]|nr:prolyl oligopeptidase family serine peptidase [Steroidobacteraceae bacterium]
MTRNNEPAFTARDIRSTPIYRQIERFYESLYGPGTGHVTDAGDLSVSPDGRTVSFTGTLYPSTAEPPVTRVAALERASGRLTIREPTGTNDRLPRWSPDGESLAYLSDPESRGDFQVFVERRGQPVRALPPLEGTIESMEWSPEGTRLLLGVAGRGADLAGCQGGATTVRAQESLPDWAPQVESGDAANLWRHTWILDVTSGRARRVGPERLNVWESCWLGPSMLACVVSDSHSEGSWYQARLVSIDIAGGAVADLYRSADQLGVPAACPAGDRIAVIEAVCSDRLIVAGALVLIDTAAGTARRIDTRGTDVTHAAWRGGDALLYIGIRGLETVAGEIDPRTLAVREWWGDRERTCAGWYPQLAPLPTGGAVIVGESFAIAPEIAEIGAGGYRMQKSLAAPPSDPLPGAESPSAESPDSSSVPSSGSSSAPSSGHAITVECCAWSARDGLKIEGLLVRPAGRGPWPLVMDIHGGPVWACRNRWQGRLRGARVLADHGVASFYPNPRGSSGRGAEFARRVKGDMGGEDTHDYLRGIDALIERGIADPARLGVTGISYGGFMSAWLVTQDDRFAAAVPISPVTDWFSQHRTSQIPYFDSLFLDGAPAAPDGLFFRRSPALYAERVRTPVLQLTGALDQNTPPTQALEFHRSLLEHGKPSVLATYPTSGHGIRSFPQVIDATARYVSWFLRYFSEGVA